VPSVRPLALLPGPGCPVRAALPADEPRLKVDSQLRNPEHSAAQGRTTTLKTITGSIAEAFTRQDAEGIAGYYTNDAQVLPPDAPLVEGREGLIAMLNATFAGGGRSLQMETISTQENGDLLVQVGTYVMGITAGGQSFDDPGKFVSVYARQPDGGLLLTVTCFNRDAPPPTA
jgi:ketosteroid isomerase-like protein